MGFISILFSFFHEIIIGSSEVAGSKECLCVLLWYSGCFGCFLFYATVV